ncbi:hypothetical protein ACI6QG_11905 [Roseococcus sp. DSY-14]|uniref:hypothetical protein n=1 Tax=Roseococcus sp. DSY-14 TaxID=3369650 RepID=UPI00387B959E
MRTILPALALLLSLPAAAQEVQVRVDPGCRNRLDVARVQMLPAEGGVDAWLTLVAGSGALRGTVETPEVPGMQGRQASQEFSLSQNGSGRVALGRFAAMPGPEVAAALAQSRVSCAS